MVQDRGPNHLTAQLEEVRCLLNAELAAHPARAHAGRVITVAGTLAALGGAVGAGQAVRRGALTRVVASAPLGVATAAWVGIGVGTVGALLAAFVGATVRAASRRPLARAPALAEALAVLRQVRGELSRRRRRTAVQTVLLRNVQRVLGKVDGVREHVGSQLVLAGKTTAAVALSVVVLALFWLLADGAGGGGWLCWGGGPLQLPGDAATDAAGRPLGRLEGDLAGNDDVARWSQALHEAGVHG